MRGVFLAFAVLALVTAEAGAATVTSFSVYSDPDDFIGRGVPRVAYPGGPHIGAQPDSYGHGGLAAGAMIGDEGVGVEIAPPPGEQLRPRNWTQIDRYPFQKGDRPGLTVTAGSRGCNVASGRLEVIDVAFDAEGMPTRLWAIFDHHCEGMRSSAFGELRWRAWVPEEAAQVTPAVLRWPAADSWWPAAPATVVYHGGATATSVGITGEDGEHFDVRADGCTGRAPPCAVEVGFSPSAPGARQARLEIADAAGATHAVSLQGFLHGGTTRADIEVLEGDVAAPPEDRGMHSYEPSHTFFSGVEYSPNPVASLFLQDNDDTHEWWNVELYAGGGQKLQSGAGYLDAQGDAHGPGPGIGVYGGPAWCNQTGSAFTVHEITYMPDGTLRSLDTSFERQCYEDRRAAARGTWRLRAGDTLPVPEWLVPGPRPQREVPPEPAATQSQDATPAQPAPATGEVMGTSLAGAVGDAPARRKRCAAPATRIRRGTRRADRLRGTARADVIFGRAGNDRVRGRAGDDCLFGGRGNDVLHGGPGRDLLDCGRGRRDRVRAGRRDRVRNCERRLPRRRAAGTTTRR